MISVPIMNLLPTVSMDYKLVILGGVLCILLGLVIKQLVQKFSWFDLIQLGILFIVLLMISRSYVLIRNDFELIRNKYLWVLLLEFLMAVNIIRNQRACYAKVSDQEMEEIIPPNTSG